MPQGGREEERRERRISGGLEADEKRKTCKKEGTNSPPDCIKHKPGVIKGKIEKGGGEEMHHTTNFFLIDPRLKMSSCPFPDPRCRSPSLTSVA
jgi:hypothetical protein